MTIFYPDIASFQKGLNLHGALVVAAKATEGTGYISPEYQTQRTAACVACAFFVGYHFLLQGNAAAQAAHAHATTGTIPLMVDFEPEPPGSSPTLNDCFAFIDAYRKLGGVTHLVYLPHWYWQQLGSPSLAPLITRSMLLVSSSYSAYTDLDRGAGWQPYGGMTPTVWQYTDRLAFGGQAVDFNAFRGSYPGKQDPASVTATVAEFRSLVTTGKLPGTSPPPLPPPPAVISDGILVSAAMGWSGHRMQSANHGETWTEVNE